MLDLKPYGAFIENTIRPLLDRLEELGINLNSENLLPILKLTGNYHLSVTLIQSISQVACIGLVCYTVWMISQS